MNAPGPSPLTVCSPEQTVNFGVDRPTEGENFRFNQHIFKPCVAFDEFGVACEPPINDFGGVARGSVLADKAVVFAEFAVVVAILEDFARHFQRVKDFRSVGEEVAILGRGQ